MNGKLSIGLLFIALFVLPFAAQVTQIPAGGGGGGGGVTAVTASSPLASSGGATPNITAGTSPVIYLTVPVTSNQLKALNVTPVTLIAAQGNGTLIEVQSVLINYLTPNGDGYSGGTNLELTWGGSNALSLVTTGPAFTGDCVNAVALTNSWLQGSSHTQMLFDTGATLLNKAVRLQLVGTALTGGTGTLSVRVAYRVHTGLS